MENVQLSKIIIVIGAIVFVATFVGLTLLARSMQQKDKSGTAALATIVFAGLTAVGMAASGMSLGTLDAAKEISTQAGVNIESVASFGMFAGLFLFWGVGGNSQQLPLYKGFWGKIRNNLPFIKGVGKSSKALFI